MCPGDKAGEKKKKKGSKRNTEKGYYKHVYHPLSVNRKNKDFPATFFFFFRDKLQINTVEDKNRAGNSSPVGLAWDRPSGTPLVPVGCI